MSELSIINSLLGASGADRAVEKPPLTDSPVMATALVSDIPAAFGSGNIGRLGVNIIANRLLAAGADPRYLGATLTIDADTPEDLIESVALGMRDAAVDAEMEWTAVEERIISSGPSTGINLSVFGIGQRMASVTSRFSCPRKGDRIIVTGPVGATGAAIEGSGRGVEVLTESDGMVLTDVMRAVYVHDPDLSAVYYPIYGIKRALATLGVEADIEIPSVPVDEVVAGACDIMGLDPLDLMTAGVMLLTVSPADSAGVLEAVRRYDGGTRAAVIGTVR